MGALSSGPCICDEWKTQGQPSGQTAVSHHCLKIMTTEYFLFTRCSFNKHKIWLLNFQVWYVPLTHCLFFLFEPLCCMFSQKPKQIRVYKSQISNAGICPSHALPGGWQLDGQGFKQGEEKELLTEKTETCFHQFIVIVFLFFSATSLKCTHRESGDLFAVAIPGSTS